MRCRRRLIDEKADCYAACVFGGMLVTWQYYTLYSALQAVYACTVEQLPARYIPKNTCFAWPRKHPAELFIYFAPISGNGKEQSIGHPSVTSTVSFQGISLDEVGVGD
jgi:hypothetical protein